MLIDPEIREASEMLLVGMSVQTTQSTDNPLPLWQQFMPQIKTISDHIENVYYSVQIFPEHLSFQEFTPDTEFQKWAAVQVTTKHTPADGMKLLTVPSGKYAIFTHHGRSSTIYKTMQYIFGMWLPNSAYQLDNRPQLSIMDKDYFGPDHQDSKEEIWIPVSRKEMS
ncbi:MAG: GyrI-like domain-containing protein [Marinoscillum sp.]